MNIRTGIVLLVLTFTLCPAMYGQDLKGSKDHPSVKRYEGSTIIHYEEQNFDSLLIPTAKLAFTSKYTFPQAIQPEGRVTKIRYKAPLGRTSLEVFRNYESALKAAGFQILYSCSKSSCGDSDTFAQTLYGVGAQPLTLNQKSQTFLAAKLRRTDGDVYVRLFAVENQSWASEAKTAQGQVVVQLDVVETEAMEGGMVTVDASAMSKAIVETGRVALYGIYFDSGKAEVKTESSAAVDEIAALLTGNPKMRLLVVGHTDTDGSMHSNQQLSQQRAAAVVKQLVEERGVAASRVTAVGVGFASPVSTNRTADGRAKNRRVELVEY